MATALYGWGAAFGLPSPSPFVMKADIQLQMLGVAFDRKLADLDSVSKHKAPYVWDDGKLVQDSTFIRWHFEKKLGADLDAGLNAEQRAHAWTLERMLEHRLVPIEGCERWLVDANFDRGPRFFFQSVPEGMREAVISDVRTRIALTMHGAGFTRFSQEERMELAKADIAAIAAVLGEKPYLFGDRPTSADAMGYGILACCANRYFDSPLPDIVERHANLTAYLARMRERFFVVDRWPAVHKAAA